MDEFFEASPFNESVYEVRTIYDFEFCSYQTLYLQNLNRHRKNRHPPKVSVPVKKADLTIPVSTSRFSVHISSPKLPAPTSSSSSSYLVLVWSVQLLVLKRWGRTGAVVSVTNYG